MYDEGQDIDSASNFGATSLHKACLGGQTEMVRWLLYNGADPTAMTKNGKRPADDAVCANNVECAAIVNDYVQTFEAKQFGEWEQLDTNVQLEALVLSAPPIVSSEGLSNSVPPTAGPGASKNTALVPSGNLSAGSGRPLAKGAHVQRATSRRFVERPSGTAPIWIDQTFRTLFGAVNYGRTSTRCDSFGDTLGLFVDVFQRWKERIGTSASRNGRNTTVKDALEVSLNVLRHSIQFEAMLPTHCNRWMKSLSAVLCTKQFACLFSSLRTLTPFSTFYRIVHILPFVKQRRHNEEKLDSRNQPGGGAAGAHARTLAVSAAWYEHYLPTQHMRCAIILGG
jgi:hypothetical protein